MRRAWRNVVASALAATALAAAAPFERGAAVPVSSAGAAQAVSIELDWDDPDLAVTCRRIGEIDGRLGVRLEVILRGVSEHGSVWVGYPRYHTRAGWRDAVHRIDPGRGRTIRLQRGHVDSGTLTVLVPDDATRLRVPLGRSVVDIDLARVPGSSALAAPRYREVDDPWRGVPVTPAPERPARLVAELVWAGPKPFGDGAIDAGESAAMHVEVRNDGDRPVRGAWIRVELDPIVGVTVPHRVTVPELAPGERRKVEIPITAGRDAESAQRTLVVHVEEPYGHDAAPVGLGLIVRAAPGPSLTLLTDLVVDGAEVPVPRDRIVTLRLRVRNVGEGVAEDARAIIRPGDGVYPAHGSNGSFALGRLGPGAVAEMTYRCYANRRAAELALEVELTDGPDEPPVLEQIVLPLEDASSEPRIVRVQPDPRAPVPLAPEPAPLVSDVDRYLPASSVRRPSGLAVVLGVEAYANLPAAVSAAADARTAARYFERALGVPADRVEVLVDDDVSLAQLHRVFGPGGWIERRVEEDTDLFVFFAGHGATTPERFVPYLLPVDADLDYVQQTGYSLDRLIDRIAALDTRSASVFLDACFSGLTREGGALRSEARPLIAVPARRSAPGIAVYSAARGSQIASSLATQGHGLFSYYLFRGLAGGADLDSDAAVTAGELKVFLEHEVPRAALRLDREQVPAILLECPDQVLAAYAEGPPAPTR